MSRIFCAIAAFLIPITLTACAPAATVVSTETAVPLPTFTPILPAPISTATITPTSAPEQICESKDLSIWVDEFVHAYGGKITVNGTEFKESALTEEICKSSDQFIQVKSIQGIEISFLVINEVPLAFRQDKNWQRITLKLLADFHGFKIGAENWITPNFFDELNATYLGLSLDWIHTHGWDSIDRELRVLTDNGMKPANITLHGGLSGGPAPEWLVSANPSDDELRTIVRRYITEMINYGKKNGISRFTLINEPYFSTPSRGVLRPDYFYERLGDEYYEFVFTTARELYPEATLILNDDANHYGLLTPDGNIDIESQASVTYNIAKKLSDINVNGVPILDAIGFQMHITDHDWIPGGIASEQDVIATLNAFKELGYELEVSEFDYSITNYPGDEHKKKHRQAMVYENLLNIALDAGISRINFWGMNDNQTWLLHLGITDGDPTMFDRNNRPKPAYYSVLKVLYKQIP